MEDRGSEREACCCQLDHQAPAKAKMRRGWDELCEEHLRVEEGVEVEAVGEPGPTATYWLGPQTRKPQQAKAEVHCAG